MNRNYSLIKFDSISDIYKDAGQVFFASMLIEPVINQGGNIVIILLGLSASMALWSASIALASK